MYMNESFLKEEKTGRDFQILLKVVDISLIEISFLLLMKI